MVRLRQISRADWGAVLLLVGLVLLFVWPTLLPGKLLAPLDIVNESWSPWREPNQPINVKNFMLSDVVTYILPVRLFLVESIRDGTFPLWNPYVFTGYPFTYNTQAAPFYPLTWLYLVFPLHTAVDLLIILQLILGALFMYLYLRELALLPLAALVGAAVFSFNGFMTIWLEWQVVHTAVIWLPLQLYLIERIIFWRQQRNETARRRVRHLSIWSGLLFGLPWLGGHWNWTLLASLTAGAYFVWRLVPLWLANRPRVGAGSSLFPLLTTVGVGTALALVQLLPAFFYLSQTHRAGLSYDAALLRALHDRFVVAVIPNFFGNPIHHNWWGSRNFAETTFYTGLVTLFLAVFAALFRREPQPRFFALWGVLGILWAVGSPAYRLLHALPVFNGLFPSRMIYLSVFAAAVLAAFGLDLLQKNTVQRRGVYFAAALTLLTLLSIVAAYAFRYRAEVEWGYLRPYLWAAALLLLGAVALFALAAERKRNAVWLGGAALLLVVVDLFAFGRGYNTVSDIDDWFGETAVANFLRTDGDLTRITVPAQGIVYPPNSSMVDKIANLSGYEPGIWWRTLAYLDTAEGGSTLVTERVMMPWRALNSPMLDALNVKYIVTRNDLWQSEPQIDIAQHVQDAWVEVASGETGQRFVAQDAGFQRADLRLRTTGSSGSVTLKVLTADGVLELAHSEVALAEIGAEWTSFYFSPFPSEWGRDFLLQLETSQVDAPVFVAAAAGDVYPPGAIAPAATDAGDLTFTTYYLPRPELLFEDGTTRVYLNEGYFDRAVFVPQAILAKTGEEALALTHANQDRLSSVVILEAAEQPPPSLGTATAVDATVNIISYDLNQVVIKAENDAPGFLLLSDTNYPGWRATRNGERTPVYTANGLLRAVYLPAGGHTVIFSFWPPDFIAGAVVSGMTLLGSAVALVATRPRRTDAAKRRQPWR